MQYKWLAAIALMPALWCSNIARAGESVADVVTSASTALKAGEFDRAVDLYERARQAMPHSPEIAYNLGVAHYRKGNYQQAAEAFSDATSLANDGSLRSRSIYNLGNAAYAQSLAALQSATDPGQTIDQLQRATDLLKDALDNYKRAITANPNDEDARANAELSHKFLKRLQELQEMMQKQQQQQNQDQQNQQQRQQTHGNQQQQQQEQSTADQSQQQEQSPQEQPQSQQRDPQSADQPQQEDGQEQEQLESQVEPLDDQPPEDQGRHVQHSTGEKGKKTMSRQEAERLLQSVRDKERQRRLDLLRREAAKYAPAEKDW